MKYPLRILLLILLISVSLSLRSADVMPSAKGTFIYTKLPATEGSKLTVAVDIYTPAEALRGDLLVLPGWNFSKERWYKETSLLVFADKYGYRCIFPEMKTTCYESAYFPETSLKWSELPGGVWIRYMLIPCMRKRYGIFSEKGFSCLLGLSTGARGAALISLQNPGLFKAGAALSGDYNQTAMPKDRLMQRLYGPMEVFGERWRSVDNPSAKALEGSWKMPIYIGHGGSDRVIPCSQSKAFAELLASKYPAVKTVFHSVPSAGHNFAYWNSELPAVFEFFENIRE